MIQKNINHEKDNSYNLHAGNNTFTTDAQLKALAAKIKKTMEG